MSNLLKADFRKFFKGRLFITLIVLLLIFPAFTAGGYFIINKLSDGQPILPVSGFTAFSQSFTPTSNFGLVFIIFMVVILVTEFNQNTIRNKVIAGYSRNTIYLSSLIFNLIVTIISFILYALLNYLLVGLVMGFGNESFIEILEVLLIYLLSTIFFYALLQLVVFWTRSTVISIVIMLGLPLISFIGIQILSTIATTNNNLYDVIKFIFVTNPIFRLVLSSYTGLMWSDLYALAGLDILWATLSLLFWIIVIVLVGTLVNKRIDYN